MAMDKGAPVESRGSADDHGDGPKPSSTIAGYSMMMILAACSYGALSTVLKLSYAHGQGVRDMTAAQYDIAFVILWAMSLGRIRRTRFGRNQFLILAGVGLCGTGSTFAYYYSLTVLPASLAIVLLFQFTWMVPVIDMVVRKKGLDAVKWIGLCLILVGTVLAVGVGREAWSHFSLWGYVCGFLAGLGYAIQLYLTEYLSPQTSPVVRSAIIITIAAIATAFIAPPTWILNATRLPGLLFWGLLAALLGQVIPMILISVSIPRIGGRMASVLGAAELPTAVIFAWIVLREAVATLQWAGVLLILAGMMVSEVSWPTRKSLT